MSAAPPTPEPAQPDPNPDRPSRSAQLLHLLRRVVDYGRELANTLRQRTTVEFDTAQRFGTRDLALILRRITLGLQRAAALEARITHNAARLDQPPASAPRPAATSAARPAALPGRPVAPRPAADPNLLQMPTPAEIAADVRRRSIGAVLADICRDLGINPCDPLYQELEFEIIINDGNACKLFNDLFARSPDMVAVHPMRDDDLPPAPERFEQMHKTHGCTGPP